MEKSKQGQIRLYMEPVPFYTFLDFVEGKLGKAEAESLANYLEENPGYLQVLEGILAFMKENQLTRKEVEEFLAQAAWKPPVEPESS